MANANQVIVKGETILDLRSDTVTPETLQKGYTAHDKSGTKITGTLEASSSGAAKETWVLNSATDDPTIDQDGVMFNVDFTSNGLSFSSIVLSTNLRAQILYDSTRVKMFGNWASEAYRKLTFDTPPTGALLTWLQANGVKQPDDTAVQDTKALTITSNGTVSVTPDAPYDALKKVDVTVNVASGGGGTCKLKINVTKPPSDDDPEWQLVIPPLILTDEDKILDANNPSAEISLPNSGLFVLVASSPLDPPIQGFTWGKIDYLSVVNVYQHLFNDGGNDLSGSYTYVCYAGDTGDGIWDIAFL